MLRLALVSVVCMLLANILPAQTPDETPPTASPAAALPPAEKPANPPADPAAKYRLEKGLRMFESITDDAIFPWMTIGPRPLANAINDEMEERAYDEVLRHARQFTTAELDQHARRDLALRDLFTAGRVMHKLELLHFEGRLKRLVRAAPSELLRESGITDVYEAWVYPEGELYPLCVFVTELPAGLTPQKIANQEFNDWVGISGYYFKLLQYESKEPSKTVLGQMVTKRAPVLMGRSLTFINEPPSAGYLWRSTFLPIVVAAVCLVAFVILGLSWYYRKTDAAVRSAIEQRLTRNPFDT